MPNWPPYHNILWNGLALFGRKMRRGKKQKKGVQANAAASAPVPASASRGGARGNDSAIKVRPQHRMPPLPPAIMTTTTNSSFLLLPPPVLPLPPSPTARRAGAARNAARDEETKRMMLSYCAGTPVSVSGVRLQPQYARPHVRIHRLQIRRWCKESVTVRNDRRQTAHDGRRTTDSVLCVGVSPAAPIHTSPR